MVVSLAQAVAVGESWRDRAVGKNSSIFQPMDFLKKYASKIALIVAILGAILLFFLLDFQQYLTLEYLKNSRVEFETYNAERPFLTMGIYVLVYILVTALSLPGAAILTLASGAIFGVVQGTIVVSFASTIGATLAMWVARTLLRQYVQEKFKEQIQTINKKIEEEGAFYLFTLRLVPAFPFFVINLVMGLTPMKAWTFAWVSQIGMLAGTVVYVNAGAELGKIESLSDIASPSLLISFALLGILPLALKKLVDFISRPKNRSSS